MSERARYTTIRDYVALLRRQRVVVIAAVALFTAAALALSLTEEPTYDAEASIGYRDLTQDLRFLDVTPSPEALPSELTERNAQRIDTREFAESVVEALDEPGIGPDDLENAVETSVSARTNLVLIEAGWDSPEVAAQIANAYADVAERTALSEGRQRLNRVVRGARQELRDCTGPSPLREACETAAQQAIAQLMTLRQIAEPAQVQARAEVPTAAASPNTVRNSLLGAFVGLVLGIGGGFLRDSLDRKLRNAHDAHVLMDMPVLGRIGSSAFGTAGLASAEGQRVVEADLEAFRILRTNLAYMNQQSPPRSVLVTSGLPEEGKSTVAASLAAASAASGQRTLLVDADLRRPAIAERLELDHSPGLAEFLAGSAEPQDILQLRKIQVEPGAEGEVTLVTITSGQPPSHPAELLASNRCADFVQKVAKAYDLVVIDSSPLLSSVDPLELLPSVEGILICARLSLSTRDEMLAVKAALERLPSRPTGIVATGIDQGDDYYGYYGYDADTTKTAA